MNIYGTFSRFIRRNEKTGESVFTIKENGSETILCKGIIIDYPRYTPLELCGSFSEENGTKIFITESVKGKGFSFDTTARFLYSDTFSDVGMALSKKIITFSGDDIFSYTRTNRDFNEWCKIESSKDVLLKVFNTVSGICEFESLYDEITAIGGTYHNANIIFDKFGSGSRAAMKKNPYIMLYAGMPLSVCEKIAFDLGMEGCDKKRIHAIVEKIIQQNERNGNTRISFHNLYQWVKRLEKEASSPFHSHPLFIAEEVMTDSYKVSHRDDDTYIYSKDIYDAEQRIASNISRLKTSATALCINGTPVSHIESMCGLKYSNGQKDAFRSLEFSGIKVITGGPGTGKTTTLNGLLHKFRLDNPNKAIALCAPTGRAARRMSECTGEKASTIHKLLGIKPYENIMSSSSKLEADLIVVDESSMIDTFIMARLLSSAKNGSTVLLLGDNDQLPSVGAGNVLGDILDSNKVETYHLDTVFRQDSRSLIIDNSRRVIDGKRNLLTDKKSFSIQKYEDEKAMVISATEMITKCQKKGLDIKVFTPTKNKKFASGSISMNKSIQDLTSHDGEPLLYGSYTFYPGDHIIFNKNNYEKGYYNGQDGIIKDIQIHGSKTIVSIESDGERISLSGIELADIDLSYAITAHKSRGGECDYAIILVPSEPLNMLKRQLLYVQITRARKGVVILTEKDALDIAISRYGVSKRDTGLKSTLIEKCA